MIALVHTLGDLLAKIVEDVDAAVRPVGLLHVVGHSSLSSVHSETNDTKTEKRGER